MSEREDNLLKRAREDAGRNGFLLCPDPELLNDLIAGLAANEERYGYGSCPCRVASGFKTYDADIICPCEYRDADCREHGMCYCGLFVSEEVHRDPARLRPIPERRPQEVIDASFEAKKRPSGEMAPAGGSKSGARVSKKVPIWRCTVCGYLAARENPPAVCPICKAKAERFERFDFG